MNLESQLAGKARLFQRAGWASAQFRGALGTDAPYRWSAALRAAAASLLRVLRAVVSERPPKPLRPRGGGRVELCPLSSAHRWLLRFTVLAGLFSAVSLWACSVPVFRYALEKWPPDTYRATVFHRGPLSPAQEALARDLTRDGLAGRLHANVSLQTVDLAQNPAPELLALWQQLGTPTLPWLIVRYPQASRLPDHIVSGPLTEATLKQAFDSPARQEITRRLGHGDSAVWVLLEIGDRKRDDDTTKLIETRLNYLAGVLKLPAIEAQDIAAGLVTVPEGGLKLAFSLLRVSRTDPAEAAFIQMLLGSEADLREIKEPILFPVFGRGRALYALAGKGISHETLDEAATFLIGKCSCQVKELNPGVDLLLAANWDKLVKAQIATDQSLPTLPTLAEVAPETVTITGGADKATAGSSSATLMPFTLRLALGFAAGGVIVAAFWMRRR
ncbi:MAG: Uncharacterized protein FD140_276 [Limisphaerales bacterium]|nr:MAG: Uncharacterized protein FD140_276 [Limisphaerales bacterium]